MAYLIDVIQAANFNRENHEKAKSGMKIENSSHTSSRRRRSAFSTLLTGGVDASLCYPWHPVKPRPSSCVAERPRMRSTSRGTVAWPSISPPSVAISPQRARSCRPTRSPPCASTTPSKVHRCTWLPTTAGSRWSESSPGTAWTWTPPMPAVSLQCTTPSGKTRRASWTPLSRPGPTPLRSHSVTCPPRSSAPSNLPGISLEAMRALLRHGFAVVGVAKKLDQPENEPLAPLWRLDEAAGMVRRKWWTSS